MLTLPPATAAAGLRCRGEPVAILGRLASIVIDLASLGVRERVAGPMVEAGLVAGFRRTADPRALRDLADASAAAPDALTARSAAPAARVHVLALEHPERLARRSERQDQAERL